VNAVPTAKINKEQSKKIKLDEKNTRDWDDELKGKIK